MPTAIPPTELSRLLQTNSSPETIAASLNEAERRHSSSQRTPHGNAKRVYPFWKTCKVCSKPFSCETREQATRKKTCSLGCANALLRGPRKRKPMEERVGMVLSTCAICGAQVWKPKAWIKRNREVFCSRQCAGKRRGEEWGKHAHKSFAARTPDGMASYRAKMTGPNNPAWKGGVTYFRKHGNYKPIKYIRCPAEFLPMARKDGYVMEHRLLAAMAMGRCLLRVEVVHHLNHDPQDNRLENLEVFASNRDHKLYEHHGSPAPIWRGSSLSTTVA